MCDPITIAAVAISAGASIYQGQQMAKIDQQNRALAKAEADAKNAALEEEKKVAMINAKEEEMFRQRQLNRNIASMKAYNKRIESESFLALVDYEKNALAQDIANIRLGARIQTSRLANEIQVNTIAGSHPDMSSYYKTSGYLEAAGTIAGGYADYKATKTPPKRPTTTTKSSSGSKSSYVTTPSNTGYTYKG